MGREDKRVEAAMACTRKDVLKEAKLRWQVEEVERVTKIKEESIKNDVSFGTRFKHFFPFFD